MFSFFAELLFIFAAYFGVNNHECLVSDFLVIVVFIPNLI